MAPEKFVTPSAAVSSHGPVLQGGQFINSTFVTQQAAAAPVALAQLPPLVSGFTGREAELAQVAGLLDPAGDAGAVVVSAVAGLAGVGKTALAVHAAHAAQAAGWFPGGVLFIDLHGYDQAPVQPGQALDALLRALGVPGEHIPDGTEQRAGLYRSVLAQIGAPVLIVADNASAEAQVRPLLPGPGPHRVIVTSRHTLAGLGARLLDVTVLDQAAAVALLDGALQAARPGDDRISGDPAAAGRLAEVCGGLPLALQITAALLVADPALSGGGTGRARWRMRSAGWRRCGMTTAAGPAPRRWRRRSSCRTGSSMRTRHGCSGCCPPIPGPMCPPRRPRSWPAGRQTGRGRCSAGWYGRTSSSPRAARGPLADARPAAPVRPPATRHRSGGAGAGHRPAARLVRSPRGCGR